MQAESMSYDGFHAKFGQADGRTAQVRRQALWKLVNSAYTGKVREKRRFWEEKTRMVVGYWLLVFGFGAVFRRGVLKY